MKDGFKICSASDLSRLVQEYGFLPLLKNQIPGFSAEEHTPPELWFVDGVEGPWEKRLREHLRVLLPLAAESRIEKLIG